MGSSFRIFSGVVEALPIASIIGVTGYTTSKLLDETYLAEKNSKKKACYESLEEKFDLDTQKAVDKVVDKFLLKMSAKQMALTQFFWSKETVIHHKGSSKSRYGTYIGIPAHYKCHSPSDVDLSSLKFEINTDKMDPVVMQNLRDSLVLSENAKMFAIASELHMGNSLEIFMRANPLFMTLGAIATGKYLFLPKWNSMPALGKFFAFVGVSLLWTVMHIVIAGFYNIGLQGVSDRKAADFGEEFLAGGLEYLNKLEQRNLALRQLGGHNFFDAKGNKIQQGLEIRKIPVSERKRCLLDYEIQQKAKKAEASS